MRLKYKDSDYIFSKFNYQINDNCFSITSEGDNYVEVCYYPVLKLDSEYDMNNFSYELFYNDYIYENSIFQVYTNSQRIGWIFPIQALLSSEHDYVDDKYFLKYAYIATCLLLKDIEQIDEKNFPQDFRLSDYVNEKNIIFVIDNTNTKQIEDFKISNYIVSLFKYGYTYNEKGNFNPSPIKGLKRLTIHPLAKELCDNPNINTLFTEQFFLAVDNEIIKFYICYQIIELLISKVFEYKFHSIIEKLSDNPEELFDLRDDLSKITAEKERVKWLFEEYTTCNTSDKTALGMACEKFLKLNDKKISHSYYYNLYSVRCILVHKLYFLDKESYNLLCQINASLLNVTIDMLFSFTPKGE